jgi:hypothetical protein
MTTTTSKSYWYFVGQKILMQITQFLFKKSWIVSSLKFPNMIENFRNIEKLQYMVSS